MIVFCYFDNGNGFSVRYMDLPSECRDEMERLRDYLPLENHEAIVPADSRGLYVVSRHRSRRAWTWIGLYRPFPAHLTGRPDAFLGIGIWLRDVALPGEAVCAVLEAAVAQTEALMAQAREWKTAQFDFLQVGCNADSARSLLSHFTTVEGGLGFGTGGAKVGIRADPRAGPAAICAAIDSAQNGFDLHDFSRALIPVDEAAARHVRSVSDWMTVEGDTSLFGKIRSRLAARTPALPPPDPAERMPKLEKAGAGVSEAEVATQRRLQLVEDEVRRLEEQVAGIGRPSYLTNVLCGLALLCAGCTAAFAILPPLVSPSWVEVRRTETPESGRASSEAVLPPSNQTIVEVPPARPTAPTVVPSPDARDASARAEGSVRTLWSLVETSPSLTSGERRVLNKAIGEFIDGLRGSSDSKLRSAGEQLGNAQAEQSRIRLRNNN